MYLYFYLMAFINKQAIIRLFLWNILINYATYQHLRQVHGSDRQLMWCLDCSSLISSSVWVLSLWLGIFLPEALALAMVLVLVLVLVLVVRQPSSLKCVDCRAKKFRLCLCLMYLFLLFTYTSSSTLKHTNTAANSCVLSLSRAGEVFHLLFLYGCH